MRELLALLGESQEFRKLSQGVAAGQVQLASGLTGSMRAYVLAGLVAAGPGVALVVTPGEYEARLLVEDLKTFLPDRKVLLFPPWPWLPFDHVVASSGEAEHQRLRVLQTLAMGDRAVVVAPVEAVLRRLVPPRVFAGRTLRLAPGRGPAPRVLVEHLVRLGYERVSLVEAPGQFGQRGGLVDFYPPYWELPVRVEYDGDEIGSLRLYDPVSQRSRSHLEEVWLYPAREVVVPEEEDLRRGREAVLADLDRQSGALGRSHPEAAGCLREWKARVEEQLARELYFRGLEYYLPYFYESVTTLADYLPPGAPVYLDEILRIREVAAKVYQERMDTGSELLLRGKGLPGMLRGYVEWSYLEKRLLARPCVLLSAFPRRPAEVRVDNSVSFTGRSVVLARGSWQALADEVRYWRQQRYRVLFLVGDAARGARLVGQLREHGIEAGLATAPPGCLEPGTCTVAVGRLSSGFVITGLRLAVFAEGDIRPDRSRRAQARPAQKLVLTDLKVGDYVVHVNHGIGRYLGLVPLEIGNVRREYLLIQYAGEDKLYVPADQVGLLQRYVAQEGVPPRLSRLGGGEWARVKGRVREAVREMARELLVLYRERESIRGHAFAPDTVWQKEFEEAFPYEETPDQLRAIEEVKADMELPRPMDRLLCGDVGYGKTEVALRAAFKAVMDGKQVAVLVPTTILAQQHYQTFRERFHGYPVRIEVLSRFRTPREQRQVIEGLARGTVDIVIGTHRLVQDDVRFKNLGLLVVDEEHRFGVAHKERLKFLRREVDVLTLTATPIPRTLQMSLLGVRDTSLLETPPEGRFPVQTYVTEEDPVLIREAIRRELARGGQVYFVYNRVADLHRVAAQVQELVPEARLAVAHGQMKEEELEHVMMNFVAGAYDVLVCTTIIESGLDVPNCNTLIVKEADQLGLAQLYQLRGRVGRSDRPAYAYFTFQRDKVLNEGAEKRLAAIKEFTEFGSGYRIALRDLEIRGAGNLLGPEQHGHMAAVGFELYCRLLEEAVREARGEPPAQRTETIVEVPVTAYLPADYVPDVDQKMDLYRRLAAATTLEEVAEMGEEMADRFGPLPEPVRNLLTVARLRVRGSHVGVKQITGQPGLYRLVFGPEHALKGETLVRLGQKFAGRVKFNNAAEFEMRLKTAPRLSHSLQELDQFLAHMEA
jgi:transcription-repair coupling factor (superfamily II helicase)